MVSLEATVLALVHKKSAKEFTGLLHLWPECTNLHLLGLLEKDWAIQPGSGTCSMFECDISCSVINLSDYGPL
jgi:hypothetical protein